MAVGRTDAIAALRRVYTKHFCEAEGKIYDACVSSQQCAGVHQHEARGYEHTYRQAMWVFQTKILLQLSDFMSLLPILI